MKLSQLLACEATITVNHRGLEFQITARPEVITPAYRQTLAARADQNGNAVDTQMLLDTLRAWTLTDDAEQVLPITAESIAGLGYGIQIAILRAITEENGNPSTPTPSA